MVSNNVCIKCIVSPYTNIISLINYYSEIREDNKENLRNLNNKINRSESLSYVRLRN